MNIQTLIANLTLEDEADRIYAAEDLGYADAAEAITPLVERLKIEPARKVVETIFQALERINQPGVLVQVAALLDSDDAFLRNQAVGLLQQKGAAAAPVLMDRMREGDPDVCKFVLDIAAGISAPEVEPIYEEAMRNKDVNILIAALEHLGAQRKTRFKSAVEEIFLGATEPMLVCAAFAALLQIGDTASWQCIRQRYPTSATVPTWELGWWVRALGDFGSAGEIEIFHELLRAHDGKIAEDLLDALERFQGRHGSMGITEDFWKVIRETLHDKMSPEDKIQLLRVAGGFSAPPSIGDYLVELLEQDDRVLKLGAIEGIKRLGRPDLKERLRKQSIIETDTEISAALGEC